MSFISADTNQARAGRGGWLPPALWGLAIAGVLLAPNLAPPAGAGGGLDLDILLDTVGHGLLFGIFAVLLWRALEGRIRGGGRWALAGASLYALVLELLQIPVPGRGWEWIDLASGVFGAALAVGWLFRGRAAPSDPSASSAILRSRPTRDGTRRGT